MSPLTSPVMTACRRSRTTVVAPKAPRKLVTEAVAWPQVGAPEPDGELAWPEMEAGERVFSRYRLQRVLGRGRGVRVVR